MKIRSVRSAPPFTELRERLDYASTSDAGLTARVAEIIGAVAGEGDAALLRFAAEFDGATEGSVADLRLSSEALADAAAQVGAEARGALERAADNIRRFHERQLERGFMDLFPDGSMLGQRVLPLRRVGVYVPGGRASYPSTVLMNVVPAQVAGVDEIVMVTPTPDGVIDPMVLAAAHLAGVSEVYRIGGAHAVGSLAYGTDTIPPVDKIVGPGNRWVAEAKRQVFGRVDIDMIAGPSEILVIADDTADARHVAADLIGQAEHDPDAIAWLVTTSESLAAQVPGEIESLLKDNPRRDVAREALEANGLILLVDSLEDAAQATDLRAPEHLELLVSEPLELAGRIRNAGAIFLGSHTPEPVGDYYAGPNHVLPTAGTARWASPLGVYDFLKRTSLIAYSAERLRRDAADVIRLAEAEGLYGHAEAVRVRVAGSSASPYGNGQRS